MAMPARITLQGFLDLGLGLETHVMVTVAKEVFFALFGRCFVRQYLVANATIFHYGRVTTGFVRGPKPLAGFQASQNHIGLLLIRLAASTHAQTHRARTSWRMAILATRRTFVYCAIWFMLDHRSLCTAWDYFDTCPKTKCLAREPFCWF